MYKFLRNLSCLLCLILVFGGCRKKAFDAYYGRPTNLEPPIYQVLQKRGNFTNLLKIIDKSGYKATLSAAGYWTFFAPNDDAFKTYFSENAQGITSVDNIPDSLAHAMVTYCLAYNAFQTDHIADYQSPLGYVPASAFKRRTAYYDGFMYFNNKSLATVNPTDTVYVSQNRDPIQTPNTPYVYGDNNNKYIPYFYSTFMDALGLSATDYNYFWPNTPYTGFNVVNASVVNKDILAENGVIHEIDHVITPLKNVEQILAAHDEYSAFKSVFEQFLVTYKVDASYTRQYNNVTGKSNVVAVKTYLNTLPYSPGNEGFIYFEPNDAQREGYTLFAPKNAPFKHYLNSVIFKYYRMQAPVLDTVTDADMRANLSRLPISVISDLMGSHMYQGMVWPTKFSTSTNLQREKPGFDPNNSNSVSYKEFGSNGIFYGVNDVHRANVFNTVYGRAYLDPNYSIMLRLMNLTYKISITNPDTKFTLFAISDAAYNALGYGYDAVAGVYYQDSNGKRTTGAVPQADMVRLLQMNTIPTPNNELNNLAGDGIAEGNAGEYIRWDNNRVFSAGTVELDETVTVDSSHPYDDYVNGRVYYLANNKILNVPTGGVAAAIKKNAATSTDPYYDFYNYLIKSSAYNVGASEILGVQFAAPYTIFIPTHAAMQQAVIDGVLPGSIDVDGTIKIPSPLTPDDQLKITQFIYYHILNGVNIAPDGKKPGNTLIKNYDTMLKDETGQAIPMGIYNAPGPIVNGVVAGFKVQDYGGNPAATLVTPNNNSYFPATSNYLGNHVIFHQIDKYLYFKKIN